MVEKFDWKAAKKRNFNKQMEFRKRSTASIASCAASGGIQTLCWNLFPASNPTAMTALFVLNKKIATFASFHAGRYFDPTWQYSNSSQLQLGYTTLMLMYLAPLIAFQAPSRPPARAITA